MSKRVNFTCGEELKVIEQLSKRLSDKKCRETQENTRKSYFRTHNASVASVDFPREQTNS